jgi:hypothetical protein
MLNVRVGAGITSLCRAFLLRNTFLVRGFYDEHGLRHLPCTHSFEDQNCVQHIVESSHYKQDLTYNKALRCYFLVWEQQIKFKIALTICSCIDLVSSMIRIRIRYLFPRHIQYTLNIFYNTCCDSVIEQGLFLNLYTEKKQKVPVLLIIEVAHRKSSKAFKIKFLRILSYQWLTIETAIFSTHLSNSVINQVYLG